MEESYSSIGPAPRRKKETKTNSQRLAFYDQKLVGFVGRQICPQLSGVSPFIFYTSSTVQTKTNSQEEGHNTVDFIADIIIIYLS